MSNRAFQWADAQRPGDPLMKLMLLVLGDWADPSGKLRVRFWNLTDRCEMTHEQACTAMQAILDAGLAWVEDYSSDDHDGVTIDLQLNVPVDPPRVRKRTKLSKTKRARILERDGHACRNCGATDDLCIDHVMPRCHGGSNADDNLQALCRRCNSSKAYLSPARWAEKRSRIKP